MDFLFNAEEIMVERGLLTGITRQEDFKTKPVAFLFQDDLKHWIVCSHRPDQGVDGRFAVSSLPKRHYTIENAKEVLGRSLM